MNLDENLDRYFRDRPAPSTAATPVESIMTRGRRRRRTRTLLRSGALAGVLALTSGAVLALTGADEPGSITVADRGVESSHFRWETVENVPDGLGPDRNTVLTADGTLYAVSTAPVGVPAHLAARPTLYRSTDGSSWSDVPVDDGFQAGAVGTAGDRVYALGTAPSGGGVTARLTDLTDGGQATVDVPVDLEERSRVAGFEQVIRSVDLAMHGETAVAVVNIGPVRDEALGALMPEGRTWVSADADGVVTIGLDCVDDPVGDCETESLEPLTWDELGVSPERVAGVVGESIVLTRTGDGEFEPTRSIVGPETPRLQAADDGFWLIEARVRGDRPDLPRSRILHAADGRDWEAVVAPVLDEAGIGFSAYMDRNGVLDGTALFPVSGPNGSPDGLRFWAADVDGGRLVDLTSTVEGREVRDVAFGPLGLAILTAGPVDDLVEPVGDAGPSSTVDPAVSTPAVDDRHLRILHTADLRTFGAHDVELGHLRSPVGLSVSADAIQLRVWNGTDDDGEPVDAIDARTDLVVGVPGDR